MSLSSSLSHRLSLQDLSLSVRLGCLPDERTAPQEVRVGVEFRFLEAPPAIQSDDLRDTICYARISDALRAHVEGREFCLVEKMAAEFYELILKMTEGRAEIAVAVHKVRAPVKDLLGGVVYRIGSFS